MTDTKLPASHGTPFAPRALVPVAVGRTSVNLYAVIDPSMHVESALMRSKSTRPPWRRRLLIFEFSSTRWVSN
jgi:hypothetical protein